ncbi:hypothetical protein AVEN_230993-1 [Araneus ventricosus]|uniref:Uncharacterized protein n=1 Tax=Araneus ventricosus TaxID=182803 RepID=A0A4Y2A303_ARAVE|nr:hypothetical protein AVEN_230993-1 [Araneus ventricosus]
MCCFGTSKMAGKNSEGNYLCYSIFSARCNPHRPKTHDKSSVSSMRQDLRERRIPEEAYRWPPGSFWHEHATENVALYRVSECLYTRVR